MDSSFLASLLSYELMAALNYTSSHLGSRFLQGEAFPWSEAVKQRVDLLKQKVKEEEWHEFETLIHQKALSRFTQLLDGIKAYEKAAYTRPKEEGKLYWQEGSTRLLYYPSVKAQQQTPSSSPIVLFIPSLIN